MDQAQLDRLLDEYEAGTKARGGGSLRRDHVRWPFRVATLELRLAHPGRTQAVMHVACRDLSASGLGVLHSAFIYPGTRCVARLPLVGGEKVDVEGVVVRCAHVEGVVHEIGIRFNKPVQARNFVNLDPFADGFVLENVDPQTLKGNVLLIEESELDQSLVRHFMRQTQVNLIVTASAEEAIKVVTEGVDLILCDNDRSEGDGAEIVTRLREMGVATPVIMLTAHTSAKVRDRLVRAQANAFIGKPLKQDLLFRAIAEFIIVDDSGGGLVSTLPEGHPNIGLLERFVSQVRDLSDQLRAAVEKQDLQKCRSLCLQIAGAAPVMGFERLAGIAQSVETALSTSGSVAPAAARISQLASVCKRISSRAA